MEVIFVALLVLLLPLLYDYSHSFKYYLKFFIYYGVVMANSVLLIPVFAFRPKNVRNLLLASAFCRHISSVIGLKWEVQGKEHLETDQACIIVSNHQSSLDVLGMFDFWPVMDKCTVVAKKEIFYAWPFGLAAWLCGLIFIPRMNSDKSRTTLKEACDWIKKDKIKLWIFPEGTRRNTGAIHDFKKGAFHLAIASEIPILPVVFSQYYFLDKQCKRFDRGTIYVKALPLISTKGVTLEQIDDVMKRTRDAMIIAFNESNESLRKSESNQIKK